MNKNDVVELVERLENENSRTEEPERQVYSVINPGELADQLEEQGYGKLIQTATQLKDLSIPNVGVGQYTLVDLVDESYNLAKEMEISVRGASAAQRLDSGLNKLNLYKKLKRGIRSVTGEKQIHRSVYSLFEEQSNIVARLASALQERNQLLQATIEATEAYEIEIISELEHRTQSYKDLNKSEIREKISQVDSALAGMQRGDPLYHRLDRQRVSLDSSLRQEEDQKLLDEDMIEYKGKEKIFAKILKESLGYQLTYSKLLFQRQSQVTETVVRLGKIFEAATDVNQVSDSIIKELSVLTGNLKSYAMHVGKTAAYAGDVILGEKIHGPITGKFAEAIKPYVIDAARLNHACKEKSSRNIELWMQGSDYSRR